MCRLHVDAGAKSLTGSLLNFMFMKNEDCGSVGVANEVGDLRNERAL